MLTINKQDSVNNFFLEFTARLKSIKEYEEKNRKERAERHNKAAIRLQEKLLQLEKLQESEREKRDLLNKVKEKEDSESLLEVEAANKAIEGFAGVFSGRLQTTKENLSNTSKGTK